MKKIITIVITIVTLLAVHAVAEAAYDLSGNVEAANEILFRGIPWELDGQEYIARLYDSIGNSSPAMKWPVKKFDYCYVPVQDGVVCSVQSADFDSYFAYLPTGSTPLEVAGHKVDTWRGYGIPTIIDNTIYDTPEYIRFITWEYLFYEKDDNGAGALFAELKEKLNSLYGEGNIAPVADGTIMDARLWYGANDTCAVLYRARAGGNVFVSVVYSRTNAKESIEKLRQLSGVSDAMNINGL